MAFTRKFLSALGIESEKIDEIITAHTEVTDALKNELQKYKEDAEKLPGVQKQLEDALKKGDDAYKEKYEQEHKEFEEYKKTQAAEAQERKKLSAYKDILKEAGVQDKRIDVVLKVSKDTINKLELDEDGNVKNADELKKAAAEEWKEFIPKQETHGTETQPHEGTQSTMTKDEIFKKDDKGRYVLSTAERQKAIAENHELFE